MNQLCLPALFIGLCSCAATVAPRAQHATNTTVVVALAPVAPATDSPLGPQATEVPGPNDARPPAFHLNGIDEEYVLNKRDLPLGSQPRTLSAWFRTTATSGAHVIANWGTPNVGQRFGLLVDAGHVKLVGEFQDLMTATAFADGEWHHAGATFDGNNAVLYVDGRAEVYGILHLDTTGERFVVGNAPIGHAPEYWIGDIDDVAVYPRALHSDEVARLAER
jgi:hypothetical protein